jgi:hypothetical protein
LIEYFVQADVTSLINHTNGETEAVVELELYRSQTKNIIISTSISKNRDPTQTWSVDGDEVEKSQLTALTDSLQIQPDNLCQFLPQDVVRYRVQI